MRTADEIITQLIETAQRPYAESGDVEITITDGQHMRRWLHVIRPELMEVFNQDLNVCVDHTPYSVLLIQPDPVMEQHISWAQLKYPEITIERK